MEEARRCPVRPLSFLSESQLERIKPFLPRAHGVPRVDEDVLPVGIIHVIRHGLQWKAAPDKYGPRKTLRNRFIRWNRRGVFSRIFVESASQAPFDGSLMIDATRLKAHRTAASLSERWISRALQDEPKTG